MGAGDESVGEAQEVGEEGGCVGGGLVGEGEGEGDALFGEEFV